MNPPSPRQLPVVWARTLACLFLCWSHAMALQVPPPGRCFVYPCPAPGNTAWVVYRLPESGTAQLRIHNEAGDLVARDSRRGATGIQQVPLNLTHYRKGVYSCRVTLELDSGEKILLEPFRFIVSR